MDQHGHSAFPDLGNDPWRDGFAFATARQAWLPARLPPLVGGTGSGSSTLTVGLPLPTRGDPGQRASLHLESQENWVRQEVNIAEEAGVVDNADLVLESKSATVVIENFFTSDGHGHGYDQYLS